MKPSSVKNAAHARVESHSHDQLLRYYESAGPDYAAWSKNLNMHFGYWRPWMNPFRREAMLEEMSLQLFSALFDGNEEPQRVLDLGCGFGASR